MKSITSILLHIILIGLATNTLTAAMPLNMPFDLNCACAVLKYCDDKCMMVSIDCFLNCVESFGCTNDELYINCMKQPSPPNKDSADKSFQKINKKAAQPNSTVETGALEKLKKRCVEGKYRDCVYDCSWGLDEWDTGFCYMGCATAYDCW